MSKLYYRFGAMGSSKTANALMTVFNYGEKGIKALLIKPSIDTRDDEFDENGNRITIVKSRIGLTNVAKAIDPETNLKEWFEELNQDHIYGAIVCDECQFLTEDQVDQLKYIAEFDDVPVLCYGLRSDFQTKLFPGSKRLFEIADSINEIKSVCSCGRKASVNARFDGNGNIVYDGEQIAIGGNELYQGMCWKCWTKNRMEHEGK